MVRDGQVIISSPDVNVEAGLTQLQVQFASASNLLRPSCAVRSGESRESSFVVANRRGVPRSPEDLLLAFDAVGGATGVAALSGAEAQAQVAGTVAPAASAASLAAANAFRGGDLDQAEAHYAEAAKLLAETGGDAKEQGIALRGLAQTQQAAGRYAASLETLRGAVTLAEQGDDQSGLASALGGLGNAYVALGRGSEAGPLLQRGITIATESGQTALAAGLWNNLGNHHAAQSSWPDAAAAYEQAAKLAQASGDSLAQAKALGNAARAALDAGQPERARALLEQAGTRIEALPTGAERAGLRIHSAKLWEQLAQTEPAYRGEALLSAHRLEMAALEESQALGAERTRSYALGNLGGLYQQEGHRGEALYLTRQAIRSAEAADAPESLYRWYWQEAQLLRDSGDVPGALAAYRRSITVLEETREEAQGRYGEATAYFRRAVAPVYLEMVDLLITRSEKVSLGGAILLAEARSTVEQLKAAELRDYFRDECVAELAAKTTTLEEVSNDAAVVYPILLPDRLELLVTLPSGLRRYTSDVSSSRLAEEVGRFRRALQDPRSDAYRALGRRLYDWLVQPYAADLAEAGVSTLVFVPDGPLRTVPMAALFDGEQFLTDRYALAVTPSLALVDPQPLDRADMQLLLGGVSESVGGFPALAMVPAELEAVSNRYGGTVLLDDDFGLRQVEQQIRETQPSVVHIASHAVFTGDPETSFVLLHDDKLTMERLSGVVGVTKFRERPLELLVLSACETAAGDERAGLGLAGVAIRAGARSAVGSLWPISDEAAFRLVDSFYEALGDPKASKAHALQRAQAKLRADPRFAHPYYWSPFLIINNWL
jgi:CHAT domain-containing protein